MLRSVGGVRSLPIQEFLTGVREAPAPDRILATVLFTDIVGSTERAAELERDAKPGGGRLVVQSESARRTARYSKEDWVRFKADSDALISVSENGSPGLM